MGNAKSTLQPDSSSVAMPGEEAISMTITKKTHFSHPEHELELKSYQKLYECNGCEELGFGPRYRCELCNFDLHKECMFTSPTTSHEFFKESTFKFFDQPTRKCTKGKKKGGKCKISCCDACGKTIYGFVYHCKEKDLDLHPCCRNLKHKISIDDVKFRLRDNVSQKCRWCKKRELPNSMRDIPGWSYVSKCEQYHFHVYCIMEMVLENWKKLPEDNNCLSLESLELPLANSSKKGRKGNKYLRIVKMFLSTIVSILLGDPTTALVCLLVELIPR